MYYVLARIQSTQTTSIYPVTSYTQSYMCNDNIHRCACNDIHNISNDRQSDFIIINEVMKRNRIQYRRIIILTSRSRRPIRLLYCLCYVLMYAFVFNCVVLICIALCAFVFNCVCVTLIGCFVLHCVLSLVFHHLQKL